MQGFYTLAEQVRIERLQKYYIQTERENVGYEFALFSIWCRINSKNANGKSFREYQEITKLNFWIAKSIAENYLGYEYEFLHDTNNWKITKK